MRKVNSFKSISLLIIASATFALGFALVGTKTSLVISQAIAEPAQKADSLPSGELPATVNVKDLNEVKRLFLARIKQVSPSVEVDDIKNAPISGLYQITINSGEVFYVDASLTQFIVGELFKINNGTVSNLTEEYRAQSRVTLLKNTKEQELIVFKAKGETKGALYAFTDVDCGYCRKFHAQVPELNEKGIEVRYLAWPRSGMKGDTAAAMTNIWCADNRVDAMTKAKQGQPVPAKTCENPVDAQFRLGLQLGIKGTPALFLADGRKIGGYRSVDDILSELKLK